MFKVCTSCPCAQLLRGLQHLASVDSDLGAGQGGGCRRWGLDPLAWRATVSPTLSCLLLQGSGGTAGAPGERGRTGPLGRKVGLDEGSTCLPRPGPRQTPCHHVLVCQSVLLVCTALLFPFPSLPPLLTARLCAVGWRVFSYSELPTAAGSPHIFKPGLLTKVQHPQGS